MGEKYEPQAFWDRALAEEFTVRGIAFPTFPESLNNAMYRSMKSCVDRILRAESLSGSLSGKSVLDIGSAIGIWIDYWRRRGASRVVGLDITSEGFDRLRERFPGVDLVRADIGDPDLDVTERFDIVSAMNMLLHVTDDDRWEQALANLTRLVKPGGILLVMDPIVCDEERGAPLDETSIERRRSVERWRRVLGKHDFEVTRLEPATVLLAMPLDTRTRIGYNMLWTYWRALMKIASGRERVGALVGTPIQLLDRVLIRVVPSGPTSKCIVARRST